MIVDNVIEQWEYGPLLSLPVHHHLGHGRFVSPVSGRGSSKIGPSVAPPVTGHPAASSGTCANGSRPPRTATSRMIRWILEGHAERV
jgi:hypothetical protein